MAIPFRAQKHEGETGGPALGEQGESCLTCGAGLATDQRYCLNCGTRRAGPRLEFEKVLFSQQPAVAAAGGPGAPAMGIPSRADWTPLTAIGSIAVLGAMLLLGVLIGKDDNPTTQVTAAPATTTPTAAAPAAPAPTPAADAGAATAPATGAAVKGGTGSTEGVATADEGLLQQAAGGGGGNKEQQEASKKLPDQVATPGAPAKQDPGGAAGNGSGATCIGC